MADDLQENTDFDPYGLSDIDKIQQEIERDLNLIWSPPSETADNTDASVEVSVDAPVEPPVSIAPSAPDTAKVFYQETIKHKSHDTRRRMSWRRMTAVICLICTLGTGTLGVGIGVAIPFTQHFLQGGINSADSGDTANGSFPYGIESASYIFSDADKNTPRDGTLSDVIKLVEPSVVSVSSVYDDSSSTGDASGIIFSEDSQKIYIATNYHVVSGAASVNVSITGSTPLTAKLVGRDAEADLAVISVEKKDLKNAGIHAITIAVFGNSDAMEVGDTVLAIGNAMGEGNSATSGIISATEKTIPVQNRNLTVLQTDAAINPGNSGGPLVNVRGEVIGINTVKLADSYYAIEGMGFSISSNIAKPILEGLMNATPRPFLGIEGTTVTEEMADQYGIPPLGVIVMGVFEGTGAEKAGIIRTDIITSFNGNAVFSMEQLAAEVQKCNIGDKVEVKILREGKTPMTLIIKLGEYSVDSF